MSESGGSGSGGPPGGEKPGSPQLAGPGRSSSRPGTMRFSEMRARLRQVDGKRRGDGGSPSPAIRAIEEARQGLQSSVQDFIQEISGSLQGGDTDFLMNAACQLGRRLKTVEERLVGDLSTTSGTGAVDRTGSKAKIPSWSRVAASLQEVRGQSAEGEGIPRTELQEMIQAMEHLLKDLSTWMDEQGVSGDQRRDAFRSIARGQGMGAPENVRPSNVIRALALGVSAAAMGALSRRE